jgi:AraC-like DNA-binding protein
MQHGGEHFVSIDMSRMSSEQAQSCATYSADVPSTSNGAARHRHWLSEPSRPVVQSADKRAVKLRLAAIVQRSADARLPTLAEVAQHFGVTPRTLQRRLRDSSTTFRCVMNEVRMELAAQKLADSATVMEAAHVAGFSEASCFHRAFKRWSGHTPKAPVRAGR